MKKFWETKNRNTGYPKQKCTNTVWTICLLSAIIIGLSAFILSDRIVNAESIKRYIDFAATLLSITLSIFAIAFTYTSNNSIQRQFDKIDIASSKIVDSAGLLQESEKEMKGLITELGKSIKHIESDMGSIKEQIPNLLKASKPEIKVDIANNKID